MALTPSCDQIRRARSYLDSAQTRGGVKRNSARRAVRPEPQRRTDSWCSGGMIKTSPQGGAGERQWVAEVRVCVSACASCLKVKRITPEHAVRLLSSEYNHLTERLQSCFISGLCAVAHGLQQFQSITVLFK